MWWCSPPPHWGGDCTTTMRWQDAGAAPRWFPFLRNTATNHLEVLHRAVCRVITGCLSSTPSSLLLLEAQLPPLKLTLEHQALSSFERALRLPPDFLSTKEETLLEIILFFGHSIPLIPTRDSDHVPLFSPHGLQPTSPFPPSFPTAQATTVQPYSSLLQTDYPPPPF